MCVAGRGHLNRQALTLLIIGVQFGELVKVRTLNHTIGVDLDILSSIDLERNDDWLLAESGESLRNGVWPRSTAVWMVAAYVGLFIIRPWEQLFPWLASLHFERVCAIAMIAVVFSTRGFRLRFDFQSIAVFLFVLSLGCSYVGARQPDLCWDPFYRYITLVLFFVVLVSVIRTPYELMFMVASYISVMAIYLAKSQWEFFFNDRYRFTMDVTRLIGIEDTFGGPNWLALSIVASLPMLLLLHRIREVLCREWPVKYRKWFRRGLVVYLILAISSLILTNSRSGMLSFVVFVGITGLSGNANLSKIKYLFLSIAFLGSLWLVLPDEIKGRYRTIWAPESGPENAKVSAEGRIEGFFVGIEMFRRFPVTGVGMGNFVEYRVQFVDGVPLQAHNLPGQLLGETGVMGGLGFILLVSGILLNCRRIKCLTRDTNRAKPKVLYEFAVSVQASIVLLLFEGLFNHNVYRFNWLWLAAFSSLAAIFASEINLRASSSNELDDELC